MFSCISIYKYLPSGKHSATVLFLAFHMSTAVFQSAFPETCGLRAREPKIHDVSLFHGNPPVVWKRVHFSSLQRKLQMKVDNYKAFKICTFSFHWIDF